MDAKLGRVTGGPWISAAPTGVPLQLYKWNEYGRIMIFVFFYSKYAWCCNYDLFSIVWVFVCVIVTVF